MHAEQWLVSREQITISSAKGWRKRVLISRSLCLFYSQDLSHIPATRRTAALSQQIKLLSPFSDPGFYVRWQNGKAQLWLWDQAALLARLPEAEHCLVLPDSALSPLGSRADLAAQDEESTAMQALDGRYILQGISGQEHQTWQQGELTDSQWLKGSAERRAPSAELNQSSAERQAPSAKLDLERKDFLPRLSTTKSTDEIQNINNSAEQARLIVLDLHRAAPLQAADKRLFGHLALGGVALLLLAIFLLQAGGALSLWRHHQQLEQTVRLQHEQNQQQQQAMRRALAARERWLARQALLEQLGQLSYVQALAKALPKEASFWQRYSYEPGRLQLLLMDTNPDPRDYVRIIGGLPHTHNVQVQLDPANQRVTVQADLSTQLSTQLSTSTATAKAGE